MVPCHPVAPTKELWRPASPLPGAFLFGAISRCRNNLAGQRPSAVLSIFMLKIVTWNINSVRKRIDLLGKLVHDLNPDVVCLQETKVTDGLFPALDICAFGLPHQAICGQKGYNGVAILSKHPVSDQQNPKWGGLSHCRHVSALIHPANQEPLRLHSLYVPAGGDKPNPDTNPKFAEKLRFLDDIGADWQKNAAKRSREILTGDFNIAPLVEDVWSHEKLRRIVTHTDRERALLTALEQKGSWIDAMRYHYPPPKKLFTWWSYRTPDWQGANKGRRLDHIWVSNDLKSAMKAVDILTEARGWPEPSDHVPVMLTLTGQEFA